MQIKDNKIYLAENEKQNPKKITGTRLAAILGLNQYSTPFQTWCDMMHVYEPPFEDTKYTIAGKTIEPKQAEYIKSFVPTLVTPTDMFGENYFNTTHGNFFKNSVFGGMWDYIDVQDNITQCVFEMKTATKSKMSEWSGKKIPVSYALQASLYAWLLGVDDVVMVATFLDQKAGDYDNPGNVIVSDRNTIIKQFKVSEKFPTFKVDYIDPAVDWWNNYVVTGISPEYDDVKDKELLDIINNNISSNLEIAVDSVITRLNNCNTRDLYIELLTNICNNYNDKDVDRAKYLLSKLEVLLYSKNNKILNE